VTLRKFKVIVIDEAQFFSERLIYLIHQLLKNGCIIIVNGLKLTAKRAIFGTMHYLLAEADEILSLKSVCNICGLIDYATRTKGFLTDSPSVDTGGAEKYYAACPACDGGEDERRFLQDFISAKQGC
jgi:thymidine kinase